MNEWLQVGLHHYLVLSALLLSAGVGTMVLKRNAIGVLIGVELVLNSANLNLLAFARYGAGAGAPGPALEGQVLAVLVIVLAAAEAAVALAIFLNFYHRFATVDVDRAGELKG